MKIFKTKKTNVNIDTSKIESKAILDTLKIIDNEHINGKFETIINQPKNKKPLIEIKNVKKSFYAHGQTKEVLKSISLNINENENLAILGGNGAGKTTLVEIIVGLNKPSEGEINFNYEYNRSYLEKIGIQFQDSSYPPGISVKNIIDFVIEIFGTKISNEELHALVKIFGVDKFYKKRGSSLSGGQLQRLNALVAIIQKPKVLFLDELSTGLDISIRTRIREFIKAYALENNMTIVLVSHDMGEIDFLCDRIVFLKDGYVAVDTSKEDILKRYGSIEKFVNTYIHN